MIMMYDVCFMFYVFIFITITYYMYIFTRVLHVHVVEHDPRDYAQNVHAASSHSP